MQSRAQGLTEASRACCIAVAERRLRGRVSEASQGNRRGGAKARAVVRGVGRSDRGAVAEASRGQVEARRHKGLFLRKGQMNRHTRYRPATTTRNTGLFAKGSVESTHKVPTSHYHAKHRTDGRCHLLKGQLRTTHASHAPRQWGGERRAARDVQVHYLTRTTLC